MSDALPVIDIPSTPPPTTAVAPAPAANGQGPPAAAGTAVGSGFAPILQQLRLAQPRLDGATLTPALDLAADTDVAGDALADGSPLPPGDAPAALPLPPLASLAGLFPVAPAAVSDASADIDGAARIGTDQLTTALPASVSTRHEPAAAIAARFGSTPLAIENAVLSSSPAAGPGGAVIQNLVDAAGGTETLPMLGPETAASSPAASAATAGAEAGRAFAAMLTIDGAGAAGQSRPLAPPSLPVNAPLHDHGFVNELHNRLVWMSRNDVQLAEIRINPPQLGPVEVRVAVSNGETSVFFSSPHAAVRDVLEAAIPRLRESFHDQGLVLADAGVSDHGDARRRGDGQAAADDRPGVIGASPEASLAPTAAGPPGAGGTLMLDVYA